ncbi:MAG: hypothetical protein AB1758_28585 [Candidatus Eremiobacterota bacterium]
MQKSIELLVSSTTTRLTLKEISLCSQRDFGAVLRRLLEEERPPDPRESSPTVG